MRERTKTGTRTNRDVDRYRSGPVETWTGTGVNHSARCGPVKTCLSVFWGPVKSALVALPVLCFVLVVFLQQCLVFPIKGRLFPPLFLVVPVRRGGGGGGGGGGGCCCCCSSSSGGWYFCSPYSPSLRKKSLLPSSHASSSFPSILR